MGGGDLNSKKSWHPNTMKNQERVWKAEQAAAEEKKRILELQRERAEERDRAELNELAKRSAGSSNDGRLNWMYDKPDKKAQDEDYLLGKSIEKNYGQSEKDEQEGIPAVSRRVAGSSMATGAGDSQVDLARKMREDPLLLVKERERAARAALLNNPLQRRRLTELLRKEQEQKKEKSKNKLKNKGSLDDKLAAKLNALAGEKTINIAKLLDSNDSSSDSEDESESKKKSKKKKKKQEKPKKKKSKKSKKKSKHSSDSEESSDDEESNIKDRHKVLREGQDSKKSESSKRKTDIDDHKRGAESSHKKIYRREESSHRDERRGRYEESGRRDEGDRRRKLTPEYRGKPEVGKRKKGLSEEERAARLAEMAAAGASREESRGRRVAQQRAASPPRAPASRTGLAHALPESLEARIHSNRHYIQRDSRHMNEHFARR